MSHPIGLTRRSRTSREPMGPRTEMPPWRAPSGTQIGPTAVERKTQEYPARRMRVKTGPCRRLSVRRRVPHAWPDRKRARPLTVRVAPLVAPCPSPSFGGHLVQHRAVAGDSTAAAAPNRETAGAREISIRRRRELRVILKSFPQKKAALYSPSLYHEWGSCGISLLGRRARGRDWTRAGDAQAARRGAERRLEPQHRGPLGAHGGRAERPVGARCRGAPLVRAGRAAAGRPCGAVLRTVGRRRRATALRRADRAHRRR